jgi:hypothetical protein
MNVRDTILTINVVEPDLVDAVKKHGKEIGLDLKGVVLIDRKYAAEALERDFPRDTTGLFTEIFCDLEDADEIQRVIKPYSERLLAATCRFEPAIQHYRNVIPFIPYVLTPSETSLLWSTEKPLMRDRLSNYDRSLTPRYQYLERSDIQNVGDLIKDFKFPVIVKPSGLAASLLVTRCETFGELRECLHSTFESISAIYAREHRTSKPSILIEEFMVGDMYSTDAYVNDKGEVFCLPLVKVITGHSIGLPGFYSYRHIIPTGLDETEIKAAFDAASSSIHALNLRSTTTHIELFYTSDGWKIIEVGARIGGYRAALYGEAYGVDHFYNDIAIHLGKNPDMPGKPLQHAAGFNIYADQEGIIESIEGFEEAQKLESVLYMHVYSQPGDEALFANNGGWFIVDGILRNKDSQKLEEDMAKIRELVKINVRPKQSNRPHQTKTLVASH